MSSPAASWGASQTEFSAQNADQGSSGQSLVQKAKEYLPGGTSSHANGESNTHSSDPTLLEKAKQYLPGSNSSQYMDQNNAGQMHGTNDMPDTPVVGGLGNNIAPDFLLSMCIWPL